VSSLAFKSFAHKSGTPGPKSREQDNTSVIQIHKKDAQMKFLYSDTTDYVDPNYDFIKDENAPNRKKYWDDQYAHELMNVDPYDGLLVAISALKAVPGSSISKTRYSTAEKQRFLREGARKFLRFDKEQHKSKIIMGDCGSFAYADLKKPAFEPWEVIEFYSQAQFTHGCHPDHIIFTFDKANPTRSDLDSDIGDRYDITIGNAEEFLKITKKENESFEPIGVVQGWSPESMAKAALTLQKIGYNYLAIGGLVPLSSSDIHLVIQAVKKVLREKTKIHLLGFAKADSIYEFMKYGIDSFDSTSPLIKAFKDQSRNFFMPTTDGITLNYYTAIRIPQALENNKLVSAIKSGLLNANKLKAMESAALDSLRGFDKGLVSINVAIENVIEYQKCLILVSESDPTKRAKKAAKATSDLERTLRSAPWKNCGCSICQSIGVDVIIFRGSNRNKRRGFHNLAVYLEHVKKLTGNSNAKV
jgi:hypothetical protein